MADSKRVRWIWRDQEADEEGLVAPPPQKNEFLLEMTCFDEFRAVFFKLWGHFALASPLQILGDRVPPDPVICVHAIDTNSRCSSR